MRPIVFFALLGIIAASVIIAYDMGHGFICGILFCFGIVLLAGAEGLVKTKEYEPTYIKKPL